MTVTTKIEADGVRTLEEVRQVLNEVHQNVPDQGLIRVSVAANEMNFFDEDGKVVGVVRCVPYNEV